jgi:hypothetical protein
MRGPALGSCMHLWRMDWLSRGTIGSCMSCCSSFVSSPVVVVIMAVWTGGVWGGRRSQQQSPSSSYCCMALACERLGDMRDEVVID